LDRFGIQPLNRERGCVADQPQWVRLCIADSQRSRVPMF